MVIEIVIVEEVVVLLENVFDILLVLFDIKFEGVVIGVDLVCNVNGFLFLFLMISLFEDDFFYLCVVVLVFVLCKFFFVKDLVSFLNVEDFE